MSEEVLLGSEHRQSRQEIASYLQTVVDELNAGDPITLRRGSDSVTLGPPARTTFEVKVERPLGANGRQGVPR